MTKSYYVYILMNPGNSVFYIGVTGNLLRRICQHRTKAIPGFTSKYNLYKLVYFEETNSAESAIIREKQLKNWHRDWKLNLIREVNPELNDLYNEILK